jgi:addiction module HigA family antidote
VNNRPHIPRKTQAYAVRVELSLETQLAVGDYLAILLEAYLKPMGIGQVEAARRLGISLNRLNEIVLGKRGITADTAIRLSRFLKTSPQLGMRLQADWDLHQAMRRERQAS